MNFRTVKLQQAMGTLAVMAMTSCTPSSSPSGEPSTEEASPSVQVNSNVGVAKQPDTNSNAETGSTGQVVRPPTGDTNTPQSKGTSDLPSDEEDDDYMPKDDDPGTPLEYWLQAMPYFFTSELGYDAYDFTMATMKLDVVAVLGGYGIGDWMKSDPVEVVSRRRIYIKKNNDQAFNLATLTASDKELLNKLCADIYAAPTAAFNTQYTTLGSRELHLGWRSHHSYRVKQDLAKLMLANDIEVKCAIEIKFEYSGAEKLIPLTFLFDPAPTVESYFGYRGSSQLDQALSEGLVLAVARPQKDYHPNKAYKTMAVTKAGEFKRGVAALNTSQISFNSQMAANEKCHIELTDNARAANGTVKQNVFSEVKSSLNRSLSVESVELSNASGECAAIKVQKSGNGFDSEFTCSDYVEMQNSGSCGIGVVISNPLDPLNTLKLVHKMGEMDTVTVDYTKISVGYHAVPENPLNPMLVEPSFLNVIGFERPERFYAAKRAFDFWMAVSPENYAQNFDGTVTELNYLGDTSFCATGSAGGLAYMPGNVIFWCRAGAMDVDQSNFEEYSPWSVVYRMRLLLHETRHAHGAPHDIDDLTIPPCSDKGGVSDKGGTAYTSSACLDAAHCKQNFCYPFRSSAESCLVSEMAYSLRDDNRRFAGQCDTWAKDLGLVLE